MYELRRPRLARAVMFKHGVAYLERRGPAERSFDLTFRRDQMNDVLKSLAVWAPDGRAKVKSFGFDSPEPTEKLLARRGLLFEKGETLDGLILSMRGRAVEVDAWGGRTRGEVIGLQTRSGQNGEQRASVLLRAATGALVIVDLTQVLAITPLDDATRERLNFLMERSQAATGGDTRAVRVELEGSADDLRVAYVVPAPAWRVSYRIARDGDAATLMAMAIVHNPVDEDMTNVELTLTTGQPVSFVIDLYSPKEVARPVVEETSRTSAPPTIHERPRPTGAGAATRRARPMAFHADVAEEADEGVLEGEGMSEEFGKAAGAAAGIDRGELFEYRVATPVSIRRGGAAEVPIAASRVTAERQLLWREVMGKNPDIVLAFTNDTGLVLEEGPLVLYEGGALAGESMLPYSPRGAPVKMTFAKDLAVRVARRTTTTTVVASVRVEENGILEEKREENHHTFEVDSDHEEAAKVIVEMPKVNGRTLSESGPKPAEETPNFYRFAVEVPAHGHAELEVVEVSPIWRRVDVESLDAHELEAWFRDKHLNDATLRALSGVLARLEEARGLEPQKRRVEAEQAAAYAKQTKLSEQLAVLKETGQEGTLRLRYVNELAAEQDKVNAAEAEIRRLTRAIDEARRRAKEALRRLISG